LRLGEEKKIEEDRKKKKAQGKNIMACPLPWVAITIKSSYSNKYRTLINALAAVRTML